MNKKFIYAGVATAALGAAVILPLAVSADTTPTNAQTTFVQKLAEKLGLSTDTVQNAVSATRTEIQADRQAEREAAITQAVSDGTLTQRQADILNAIETAMHNIRDNNTQSKGESMRDLTPEERRTQMDTELVTALNDAGLNTTAEEVQAAREAAHSADILPGFGGPGEHGPRGGMGL